MADPATKAAQATDPRRAGDDTAGTRAAAGRPPGLRERKRLAGMRHAQQVALDLYDARGYDAVTVEDIAAAADVSPSSVYRWFGGKEQILLWDDYDPDLMRRLTRNLEQSPPVEALRQAVTDAMAAVFDRDEHLVRRRLDRILAEPALQAASAEQMRGMAAWAAGILAERTGRRPDDLEAAVAGEALVAALVAALRHWHAGGYAEPLADTIDRALAVLDRGLRL